MGQTLATILIVIVVGALLVFSLFEKKIMALIQKKKGAQKKG